MGGYYALLHEMQKHLRGFHKTCPNCKRSRGLRPVKPEDEVFFLKVSEGEAAEFALLLSKTRCAMRYTP